MAEEIDVPQYFICPISLQIMKDPVTAVTGITYDRESIEYWLRTAEEATCPVTKQPLPADSDLTPNHMLRRLIQAWCITNAENGIDRIPTPKSPLNKFHVMKLIDQLQVPQLFIEALRKMDSLATSEDERSRKCMKEAGVSKAMISLIIRCFKEGNCSSTSGLEEALRIFHLTWIPINENKQMVRENHDLVQSLTWVLSTYDKENHLVVKTHAMISLKIVVEVASMSFLERLKPEFFKETLNVLRTKVSLQAVKSALHALIQVCPWGRNRTRIVEAGAVLDLVELELGDPEKSVTELIFCLLAHLCSCADGRAQLLKHAGGVAMVAKRTLRVSPATDDRALHILEMIARYSASHEVLTEMLRVGAVSKLCMVLQANCDGHLKKKAREILRLHSSVWSNSPCIQIYLVTRYPK